MLGRQKYRLTGLISVIIFICNIQMKVSKKIGIEGQPSGESKIQDCCQVFSQSFSKAQELADQIFSHVQSLTYHHPISSPHLTHPITKPPKTQTSTIQKLDSVNTKLKQLLSNPEFLSHLPHPKDPSIKTNQSQFSDRLQEKENKIRCLQNLMKEEQKNFKNIQLKLLRNVKKLNLQLCQKEKQIKELKEVLAEKEQEIDSLTKINERKYRKIRELEEDVFDLESQLENKKEELESVKECSYILEEKLSKMATEQSFHTEKQEDTFLLADKDTSQIEIQTEQDQSAKQRELSQFLESKESKYLESIQRLTFELSQAYQRINQLTKGNSTENLSLARQIIRKSRTTSTYFSRKT